LLSIEQARDPRMIQSIVSCLKDNDSTQVAVILCGPQEPNALPELPWPTVLDPEGRLANELEVHGWPTALVLQRDGLQVANIGGAADSFAMKLVPYLDLAEKGLDRAVVEQQLASPKIVSDGPSSKTDRNLQRARKLTAQGDTKQAHALLAETLREQPNLPLVKVEIIRVFIAEQRWKDAKVSLLYILKESPNLAEAHYLLGIVYEHEEDWPQAALEFRKASHIQD